MKSSDSDIRDFRVEVDETALDDLRERLSRTRWPDRETVSDSSQGLPLGYSGRPSRRGRRTGLPPLPLRGQRRFHAPEVSRLEPALNAFAIAFEGHVNPVESRPLHQRHDDGTARWLRTR